LSLCRDPPTLPFSTLSLHDALPISSARTQNDGLGRDCLDSTRHHIDGNHALNAALIDEELRHEPFVIADNAGVFKGRLEERMEQDRKSTRLNSSHQIISYAVFCLKT